MRRIGAFASSTSQVTCAWGCSARIRQGRSCRLPVYDDSRFRSALPPGVRGPILNGGRLSDWPSRRPWPSMDGSYRPTTMPRSAAYAKPGPGQSRLFSLPPRTWVRSTEKWAASPWPMARDQATCRAYTLRRPTGRHRRRRGSTTGLFRARPAVSGQLALAPPRRQVPCTAETRRRSLGHGRIPRPAGDYVNSCCAVPEGSRPKKSRRMSGSPRPGSVRSHRTAVHGREVLTHGATRHGADHREQLAPFHWLFRRQSLLVPAPHRHHP